MRNAGRHIRGVGLGLLALLLSPLAVTAQQAATGSDAIRLDEFGDPEDLQSTRERMTEREDENRVAKPMVTAFCAYFLEDLLPSREMAAAEAAPSVQN